MTRIRAPQSGLFTPIKNSHKEEEKAAELLGYVKKADYDMIEIMLDKNPTLMFIHVKDINNKNISPLQKAFENYDTYTWKMLYEKIKDEPELVKQFTEQAHQQKEHINLKPLFDAYATYTFRYQLYLEDKITDTQLDADWLELGKKQGELLPTHMLREFCRRNCTWYDTSTFDVNEMPAPKDDRIYNTTTQAYMNLDGRTFSSGLGTSFSLVRAEVHRELSPAFCMDHHQRMSGLDSAIFDRLCEIRRDDLTKQINLLDQSLQQSPTCKK